MKVRRALPRIKRRRGGPRWELQMCIRVQHNSKLQSSWRTLGKLELLQPAWHQIDAGGLYVRSVFLARLARKLMSPRLARTTATNCHSVGKKKRLDCLAYVGRRGVCPGRRLFRPIMKRARPWKCRSRRSRCTAMVESLLEFLEPRPFAPDVHDDLTLSRNLRFNFAKNYTAFRETGPAAGKSRKLKMRGKSQATWHLINVIQSLQFFKPNNK